MVALTDEGSFGFMLGDILWWFDLARELLGGEVKQQLEDIDLFVGTTARESVRNTVKDIWKQIEAIRKFRRHFGPDTYADIAQLIRDMRQEVVNPLPEPVTSI